MERFFTFRGALPPAVLCFMLAEQYKQEPTRVASIVLIGNIAAIVWIPLALAPSAPYLADGRILKYSKSAPGSTLRPGAISR